MKLTLRTKIMGIPLILVAATVILLMAVSLWVVNSMWQKEFASLTQSQAGLAEKSLASLEKQALMVASMAAETPGVEDAYRLALAGKEDEGRMLLRRAFDPIHARVTQELQIKALQVHFHLPPAKSFLRIWRKPGEKDGGDDLSSFRKTVLQVNQSKKRVSGIEIGRGGFAMRGLVPVRAKDGAHLGSVEALFPINRVFETALSQESDHVAVYMLASELEIARRLKEKKPPVVGEFARIFTSSEEATDPFITAGFLARSKNGHSAAINQGRILTGVPIKDFTGDTKGILVFARDASDKVATIRWLRIGLAAGSLVLLAILSLFLFLTTGTLAKQLNITIDELDKSGTSMLGAAQEINSTSHQLAEGASEQAASLEETSSSLEEMASMTRKNSEHAQQAEALMKETGGIIEHAGDSMTRLTTSMEEISKASEETSKIIKTIDEIAFQTNLLALNAAVEAARAGEAGAGFAVVADEVRNLAMRAAEAARNTAELIEGTVQKVKVGEELVTETSESFGKVSESSRKISSLISEIAVASREQATGIDQVNKAISQIDAVTQQNAASAEEAASASEELTAQAGSLKDIVGDLVALVTGEQARRAAAPPPAASTAARKQTPHAPGRAKAAKPLPPPASKQAEEDEFEDF